MYSRKDLLNRVRSDSTYKITLNVTFHPAYQNLNRLLRKLHVISACDSGHKKAFKDIPVVCFRRGKSLKDFLVRVLAKDVLEAIVSSVQTTLGKLQALQIGTVIPMIFGILSLIVSRKT